METLLSNPAVVGRAVSATAAVTLAVVLAACSGGTAKHATPPSPSTTTSAAALPVAAFATWTGREPSIIDFSADSGNVVTELTWSWTATVAVGHGTWTYDSCVPNCAAGPTAPYPATVTLSHPVGGQFTEGVEQTSGPHAFTYDFTLPSKFLNASSSIRR